MDCFQTKQSLDLFNLCCMCLFVWLNSVRTIICEENKIFSLQIVHLHPKLLFFSFDNYIQFASFEKTPKIFPSFFTFHYWLATCMTMDLKLTDCEALEAGRCNGPQKLENKWIVDSVHSAFLSGDVLEVRKCLRGFQRWHIIYNLCLMTKKLISQ